MSYAAPQQAYYKRVNDKDEGQTIRRSVTAILMEASSLEEYAARPDVKCLCLASSFEEADLRLAYLEATGRKTMALSLADALKKNEETKASLVEPEDDLWG